MRSGDRRPAGTALARSDSCFSRSDSQPVRPNTPPPAQEQRTLTRLASCRSPPRSADVERLAALGVQGAIGAGDERCGVVAGAVLGQSDADRIGGERGQHAFGELEPNGGIVPGGTGKHAEKLVAAIADDEIGLAET